jgi:hypothetical protein
MKLTFKKEFYITTTKLGEVIAKPGDTIECKEKNAEYFYIVKLNNENIFSCWKKKSVVMMHCEKIKI